MACARVPQARALLLDWSLVKQLFPPAFSSRMEGAGESEGFWIAVRAKSLHGSRDDGARRSALAVARGTCA